MRLADERSWEIRVSRWLWTLEGALWIREAERLDVPAGGVVPGPLDIDPVPAATVTPTADLVNDWRAWWHALTTGPPDLRGLADRPALREVMTRRWSEARTWHTTRRWPAAARRAARSLECQLVAEVERSVGRRLSPFTLEFVVLPVRDDEIRRAHPARYLVPERIFEDERRWGAWLRPLVSYLGTEDAQ